MALLQRPVVGRAEEMREVADAVFAADASPVVLLQGEAGIGKTAIWEGTVAEAAARGRRVLVARPAGSDAALGYMGLADLLDAVFDEIAGALAPPQRRALSVALLREEPGETGPGPRGGPAPPPPPPPRRPAR